LANDWYVRHKSSYKNLVNTEIMFITFCFCSQTFYREALKYIEGYARALTNSDGICRHSDMTMVQTNTQDFGGPGESSENL